MEEVDYKKVRQVMWTDRHYRLRELPDFYGFPLLIKVTKGASNAEQEQKLTKGEVLRVHGEQKQRRVIATDSKGRHWSFPVHIGAKFDVPSKKAKRESIYMSDIVDAEKLPKKFRFAKKDHIQINITGEDPAKVGPLIEGEFKTQEITRVRIFKANRITGDEIDPEIVFLPAYLDMEVTIGTKIACEPDAFWDDYMDAITNDIQKMVNLDMYRGKSDIQIYELPDKAKKSKRPTSTIYEEHAPVKSVTIGNIIKQRTPSTKSRGSTDEGRPILKMSTFSSPEGAEAAPEEPQRAVMEILSDLQDKDENELTEEEIRVARHRRMLLAMLAQEEEEEEERRRSMLLSEGSMDGENEGVAAGGGVGDAEAAKMRGEGDGDDDQADGNDKSGGGRPAVERLGSVPEEEPKSDEVVVNRPRSPGDGSTVTAAVGEEGESVFVEDLANPPHRGPPPRIPTRRTQGLSSPKLWKSPWLDSDSKDNSPPKPTAVPPKLAKKPPVLAPKPKLTLPPSSGETTSLCQPVIPRAESKVTRALVVSSAGATGFTSIQDYPADLTGLTIDDICQAMGYLRLGKYEQQIREQKIDGELAKELSEDMMKNDLGLSGLEARKFYKFIHNNWRPV